MKKIERKRAIFWFLHALIIMTINLSLPVKSIYIYIKCVCHQHIVKISEITLIHFFVVVVLLLLFECIPCIASAQQLSDTFFCCCSSIERKEMTRHNRSLINMQFIFMCVASFIWMVTTHGIDDGSTQSHHIVSTLNYAFI